MTKRVKYLLDVLKSGRYKAARTEERFDISEAVSGYSNGEKDSVSLKFMLEHETLNAFDGDRIGFNRTHIYHPDYFYDNGKKADDCGLNNITPDYAFALNNGFDFIKETVIEKMNSCKKPKVPFYNGVLIAIDGVLEYADRCRDEAKRLGISELYNALCRIPHKKAETYYEACVFMKLLIYTMRCNRNHHVTLGRFDQYMKPFFDNDVKRGVTHDELLEITEEFFISLNFDTDIYVGVQQGDNGQSMVLGGYDLEGNDMFNELSEMCMKASMELKIIDPKINLRVSRKTPIERLEFATEMTKLGLGFPQYCNDDIVVPGLIALGYSPEDAVQYTVAACWEFIIPGKAYDIVNIAAFNFPAAVETAVNNELLTSENYNEFFEKVRSVIIERCDGIIAYSNSLKIRYSPYFSLFVSSCLEKGLDIADGGADYNNFGVHGAGISTAADSLAAIKKVIFDEKSVSKEELLEALKNDFEGYGELRNRLLSCPKMGNNDDYVDNIACDLMETFSSYLNGKPNSRGGIFRAGTGSAMEYILSARRVGATADGRKNGQPYGSSFSPSPNAQLNGPLSVIQSFTKFDLKKIINGGPMTMEVHDTVFRNGEGVKKTAQLVKAFIDLGGHQLQLNSINRDVLLDAEAHPESHKNLIVRVWGWSGYFIELDEPYRKHIISRTEHKY